MKGRANKRVESKKQQELRERTLFLIEMLLVEKKSIREMERETGIKKSTIHRTLREYTRIYNPQLWEAVEEELENNYYKGVSKGGSITWERYRAKWLTHLKREQTPKVEETGTTGQYKFIF